MRQAIYAVLARQIPKAAVSILALLGSGAIQLTKRTRSLVCGLAHQAFTHRVSQMQRRVMRHAPFAMLVTLARVPTVQRFSVSRATTALLAQLARQSFPAHPALIRHSTPNHQALLVLRALLEVSAPQARAVLFHASLEMLAQ